MSEQKLPLLKVKDLHVYYGAIHAIKGISLEVSEGEIVTLIGANGAGKSTTLNTVAGLLKPRQERLPSPECRWKERRLPGWFTRA